jgi:ligand-binding sensor domain-containing protein/two-component sensor histidine kinase
MITRNNRILSGFLSSLSCCIVICACSTGLVFALDPSRLLSQFGHDIWQREQGLPNNTIHAILQTQDGYLWLATEEGLVRFDGVRFKNFDTQNTREIASNQIQVLFEDKQGELWIGTAAGLTRYKDQQFNPFTTGEGLPNKGVSCIWQDGKGNVWVGTAAGLWTFDGGKFVRYSTRDGLPNDSIRSIYEDRSGALWVTTLGGLARLRDGAFTAFTTREGLPSDSVRSVYEDSRGYLWINTFSGLARFKDGRFTVFTTANGLLNDHIWSIEEDRKGTLWIGTDGGLNSFSNGSFKAYTTKDGLPDNSVWSIYEDRAGVLWVATPGGLGRLKDGELTSYTSRDGLSDDVVMALFEDREGSLWIGTEAGGLNRLKDAKFTAYSAKDGLTNDFVWAVCQAKDGSLWAGTNGGGLNRFRDGKFTSYTTKDRLASNIVRALCEDRAGNLWAGTPGGLNRLRGGRIETYTVEDGLSNNAVSAIEEDRAGNLWIGTLGGLTRFKDGRFTIYTTADGLSDDSIISLRASRDGGLWIGTRTGGLNRMEGERFTSYRAKEWIPNDSVRSIYEDEDGTLWVGTRRSGLSRFRNQAFTTCTMKAGLFDDCVFQIIGDDKQNLWMSSPRGVFRVSKKEFAAFAEGSSTQIASVSYGTADGMLSRECNGGQPGAWKSDDGKLWFATIKGIAMIDPQRARINDQPPPVAIERAVVDGEPVQLNQRVELPPGKERYEFYYTAMSFAAPEKVRFKYKLEGFDKDWVAAGAERVGLYTHLPPGTYKFRVIACNNDGVWNETGALLDLYLNPYFYQTYWFYAGVAVSLGLLALGIYRLRVQRISAKFAAVLEERNRMAREIHDTLAQSFVGIALQLKAVENAMPDAPDKVEQHLALAQSMVSHSLVEARRTVWNLRSQALETNDLATAFSDTARQMTEGSAVVTEVRVSGESRRLPSRIENNALRIGQEALTNAIKHAEPKHVLIELDFEAANLQLRVKDDGRGFDTEGMLATADGHFGLLGMRERAEHCGGRLRLSSRPGEGTEVWATIPIS